MGAVMKTSFRISVVSVLAAAFVLSAGSAQAGLFGRGEKGRLFDKADAECQAAEAAARDRRVVDQIATLKNARATYLQLASQYPDYEAATVRDRLRRIEFTLASLNERMERGELVVEDGDASAQEASGGPTVSSIDLKKPTDPAPPDFRRPIPALVRTAPDGADRAEPAAPPAAESEPAAKPAGADPLWLRESIPNPLFAGAAAPAAPAPAEAAFPASLPVEPRRFDPAAAVPPTAPVAVELPAAAPRRFDPAAAIPPTAPPPAAPAALPREDAVLLSRIESMIRERRAGEAVVMLEDLIEAEGADASLRARVLLVRALVELGNYARAEAEIEAAARRSPADPAVRSLRAAVAVARGNVMEAQRQLDLLVREHRDYSDAYVDFAYVTFLSGPTDPDVRKLAVSYYKTALERGAARDPRLEAELDVRVE